MLKGGLSESLSISMGAETGSPGRPQEAETSGPEAARKDHPPSIVRHALHSDGPGRMWGKRARGGACGGPGNPSSSPPSNPMRIHTVVFGHLRSTVCWAYDLLRLGMN
ncbi:hypothetical protein PGT21_026110 [Puccinia graminis f. sp. tritici]|uniref:Uncharacterized protein n=1 Tax=Puccinia graminis f. sp. tritici TaxID=56615 RepID=A0A5B0ML56_PUCGR|nr:hypothetical protein PGT21_026110 [Puccinia graminis f. sp. tritici]KAA1118588.1 hypothetical protein PGTUg99_012086 [Puccinia graminis f. sp. tritici]